MSSTFNTLFLILLALLMPTYSSFIAPVVKDHIKRHYTLNLYLQNPPTPKNFLLDLCGTLSWVGCTTNSNFISCSSSMCHALSSSSGPICTGNNCYLESRNSLSEKPFLAIALVDSLALSTTDGRNLGQLGVVPEFILSCSDINLQRKLPKNVDGLAGFSRSDLSLVAQVSKSFSLPYVFALCLSGSPSAPGVGFFGTGGPYYFRPEIDLSRYLSYTPLLSMYDDGYSYYIGVSEIKVNGKDLQLNQISMAQISTTTPYTVLHSAIYKDLIETFERESARFGLTVRPPVKPFGLCYNADGMLMTRTGPAVPTVDLVFQSEDVFWRIFGVNSMVRVRHQDVDAWCLGFVDGGDNPRSPIVIGGHQIEDNLLQFDLQSQRLGFTSSVMVHNTMCSNFNFTTNANVT